MLVECEPGTRYNSSLSTDFQQRTRSKKEGQKCSAIDCYRDFYYPNITASMVGFQAWTQLYIMQSTGSEVHATEIPILPLVEYLCYLGSIALFWISFSIKTVFAWMSNAIKCKSKTTQQTGRGTTNQMRQKRIAKIFLSK